MKFTIVLSLFVALLNIIVLLSSAVLEHLFGFAIASNAYLIFSVIRIMVRQEASDKVSK
jgi:hypothetical protein